ncbi:MAG: oligoendopeptidase F, partial [Firmicutes bacterium]|nr:oligoendopeptidase F [Bacillota bacterium]
RLKDIKKYDNKLTPENALECLRLSSGIGRDFERLYVYALLRRDEDTADSEFQALAQSVEMLSVEVSSAVSFISPAMVKFPLATLKEMQNGKGYEDFSMAIGELIREKKHILSKKEEKILSETGAFSRDFKNVFTMLNNADLKFGTVKDEKGNTVELTHGTYSELLQNSSQEVREKAFKAYYASFISMANTISATYAGSVKKDCAYAKIRGYKSAISRALFAENVSETIYKNLISATKKGLPFLHDYFSVRKSVLNLTTLNMYDMHLPIIKDESFDIEYSEAYNLVKDALKPLGQEYGELLNKAYNDRWIDVYETKNKRSGAYSWGCYDSVPIVLLNYKKTTHDIFTVAHEMGHAMHSYFSNKNQPYEKAGYSIFVAEVASTVNEVLLLKHLLKTATGAKRVNLLSYYLDMFRTTFFRQTMFAEFENRSHAEVEKGNPLTLKSMCDMYLGLNKKYHGKGVTQNAEIAYEWARIPHFYNAFYVYKYATGLTSAVVMAKKILTESGYLNKYLKFLSAGGSDFPTNILANSGADLSNSEIFDIAISEFKDTLEELKRAITQLKKGGAHD